MHTDCFFITQTWTVSEISKGFNMTYETPKYDCFPRGVRNLARRFNTCAPPAPFQCVRHIAMASLVPDS